MENQIIRLAFAVDQEQNFQPTHFGDAFQYLIYEWSNGEFQFIGDEENCYKNLDEEVEHGSAQKGQAITKLLKGKKVNVLVSKQFGRNIKMVNQHFIPVIIYSDTPDMVLSVLGRHMKWIDDELQHNSAQYKLFTIKDGIMKTAIKE